MRQISMLSAVMLCFVTVSWAQQKAHTPQTTTVFIPVNTTPAIAYQYHDGNAQLIDGTPLKGRFQYNGGSAFIYRANSQATRQKIGFSMIRRLVLAGADTAVTDRTDSTVFLQLGHRLYRQLTGKATMILDHKFAVDEERGKLGRKLYVLDENSDMHKFTSLQKLNQWFYAFRERSGKQLPDVYLNENEIVKAVARLNEE